MAAIPSEHASENRTETFFPAISPSLRPSVFLSPSMFALLCLGISSFCVCTFVKSGCRLEESSGRGEGLVLLKSVLGYGQENHGCGHAGQVKSVHLIK